MARHMQHERLDLDIEDGYIPSEAILEDLVVEIRDLLVEIRDLLKESASDDEIDADPETGEVEDKPIPPAHGGHWAVCGHRNYGDVTDPASVFRDCATCGGYYCDQCNYDRHVCGGCGFEGNHVLIRAHWAEGDCTL